MEDTALLETLWKVSWQVAAVAAVIWLITRIARRAPASWRYALWLIVLIKFFVPPFAYFPSELAFSHKAEPARPIAAITSAAPDLSGPVTTTEPRLGTSEPDVDLATANAETRSVNVLSLIWLTGACVMALTLALRFVRQVKLVRSSSPASQAVTDLLEECSESLRIRRLPEVRLSDRAFTPMVVGVLRPVVLLPKALPDLCSPSDLKAMLLHELAHVKRHDMAVVWLHQLMRILFFFHPAAWLAGRELARERELACDETVLSNTPISPEEYASGYVSALKLGNASPAVSTSLAMAEPFELEKRRLNMILRSAVPRLSGRWKLALLAVVVIGLPTFIGTRPILSNELSSSTSAPTPAYLAAALRNQENACGPSLEVRYTHDLCKINSNEPHDVRPVYYVRTPDVLYMEFERASGTIEKHCFDRASGERRSLEIQDRLWGSVAGYSRSMFSFLSSWETARHALRASSPPAGEGGVLCEQIAHGVVAEEMEEIDGHPCWRVEIDEPPERSTLRKRIVWLDPTIGFCPRRVELPWKNRGPLIVTFKDYREVGNGVWLPWEQVSEYSVHGGEKYRMVNTLTDAKVGRAIPKSDLLIEFPSGTRVYDQPADIRFTVP